ncbi:MAG: amidohydrolase family protein [Acidobacteria bacterium]|nr:amidohydrolase family protein [Acidobacteriota bacterium]
MRKSLLGLGILMIGLGAPAAEWDLAAELAGARAVFEANLDAIRNRDRDAYLNTYLESERLARTGPAGISLGFAGLEASAGAAWPDTFEGRDLDLVPVRPGVIYGTYRYRVRYGDDEQTGLSERLFVKTDQGWRIAVTTAFANPPEIAPVPVAIVGGTLIDGTGAAPLRDSVITIRDGLVECAGGRDDCSLEGDYAVIDASGRWVTPGLIDAHVHYAQTGWADGRPDSIDVTDQYPYEEAVANLRENSEEIHRSLLCAGITSAFDVGGYPWTVDVRDGAVGTSRVPNLAAAGPLLSTVRHEPLNLPGEKQIMPMSSPAEARGMVRYIDSLGADAVKVWLVIESGVDVADLEATVMAAGAEAAAAGLPLIVHATELEPAKLALRAGAKVLVHGVRDQVVDDEFLELLEANEAVYVPTLVVGRGYLRMHRSAALDEPLEVSDPNQCVSADLLGRLLETPQLDNGLSTEQIASIDNRLSRHEKIGGMNIMRVHDAGGIVAVGTDAGNPLTLHGPSIYTELEAMEKAGVRPADLLVMATRNGALAMGREDLGTVRKGNRADLLILRADPLETLRNLEALETVILRGVSRSIEELRRKQPATEDDR